MSASIMFQSVILLMIATVMFQRQSHLKIIGTIVRHIDSGLSSARQMHHNCIFILSCNVTATVELFILKLQSCNQAMLK